MTARLDPDETAALVRAASDGDSAAWRHLVDAHMGLLWAITRSHRLSESDGADVVQVTWLRLFEHLGGIDDPARVGAWLATTAKRECLRVLERRGRTTPVADLTVHVDGQAVDDWPDMALDAELLAQERRDAVRVALAQLPARCRELLALLMLDPPPSYEEISAALDMPIGSIGPTRGRCLRRLERQLARMGLADDVPAVFDGHRR